MQLWLILMIIIAGLLVAALIKIGGGGYIIDLTPIVRTPVVILAFSAGLGLYLGHLNGCLNHRIGTSKVATMEHVEILPVEQHNVTD